TGATDSAGAPRSYAFWGTKTYVEGAAYAGILPLLLALVALVWRRNRYTWTFALYAVFSLLLAFGTPLYAIFFFGVPGFSQLHTPFRWLFPYTVSVAVLAGIGASVVADAASRTVQLRRLAWLGAAASVAGGGLLIVLILSRVLSGPALRLADKLRDRSQDLSAAFASGRMIYSYELRNFLIFALLLLASGLLLWLAGRRLRPTFARSLKVLMVGIVVVDLFVLGVGFNSTTKPALAEFTPPSLQFLQQDTSLYRVASFGYDDILSPNTGMLAGLQDVRGYDSIILRQYAEFWGAMEEPHGLLYNRIYKIVQEKSLRSPLLNLMNVKYVLSKQRLERPNLEEVYRGDDLYIYRNRDALPRAFAVFSEARPATDTDALTMLRDPTFDPTRRVIIQGAAGLPPLPGGMPAQAAQVEVESYKPNQVTVRASMPAEGYLLLADTYYPGWRAEVDGKAASVLRADYNFRAVRLAAGEHTVTLRFSPDSFKLGLYMSILSLVLVLLMLGYGLWSRIWRESMEASAVRRIAKNSVTPMAAQITGRILDFGFAIFMLRLLGPTNAGRYAFAVFLIGYFLILTDFGLGTLLTREVARDRSQARRYLGNTIVMRLWLCLASVPIILALVGLYYWRFDLTSTTAFAILLFTISLVPSAVSSAVSAIFNAYEKMEFPAAVAIVTTVLRVSLGVAVLLLGWGIVGLAGVSVVASTVTAVIFLIILAKSFFRPSLELDPGFQREMAKVAAPLMLNNFLSTIFFRVDVMLLKPMRGDAATGYYTTAYKFIDGLNIIPAFFTLAIFPIMSRHAEGSRESLLYTFERSLKVMLIVALPITVITTIIAGQIIPLFFGQDYAPSVRALQILIWFLPFSYVNSVTQYALIAVNQQRFLTVAFLIGVGFNIVANLVAIPLWGFNGAAGATIASEVVLMIPFFYSVRRHLGPLPLLSVAQRPAIAALVMGAVLLPLREVNWVLISLLGLIVYGGVLLLLGTFDEADRRLLRALRARQ
ncbi:MAG: oligosaccharide flippase family protein, partial [Chloroflexi bacterium]|nr:oligosaccharide flippase family protein [Chloroflexota bacterium]